MANALQLSAQCPTNRLSSLPEYEFFPARVIRQQPQTQQTPRFLGMQCLVRDHQTWERRIDLIPSKNFRGYPRPRKYFYTKI